MTTETEIIHINYQISAELLHDKNGPLLNLIQTSADYCDPQEINLHPWQMKEILTRFGVISPDQESAKKIATLERHILLLRDRIETMFIDLCDNPGRHHADMSGDVAYAQGTLDLANEFCHDLDHTPTDIVHALDQKAAP
jgi:hypothetical protein